MKAISKNIALSATCSTKLEQEFPKWLAEQCQEVFVLLSKSHSNVHIVSHVKHSFHAQREKYFCDC